MITKNILLFETLKDSILFTIIYKILLLQGDYFTGCLASEQTFINQINQHHPWQLAPEVPAEERWMNKA